VPKLQGSGQQRRHGHVARALAQGHPVLQEDRHADGRDQGHQARAAAQGLVGHLLDHEAIHAGDEHRHQQHQRDQHGHRQAALRADGRQRDQAGIGTDHVHLAVGEVDHADDAVHHRVADGDQRVDGAQRQPLKNC
jgi:hypothetical protein